MSLTQLQNSYQEPDPYNFYWYHLHFNQMLSHTPLESEPAADALFDSALVKRGRFRYRKYLRYLKKSSWQFPSIHSNKDLLIAKGVEAVTYFAGKKKKKRSLEWANSVSQTSVHSTKNTSSVVHLGGSLGNEGEVQPSQRQFTKYPCPSSLVWKSCTALCWQALQRAIYFQNHHTIKIYSTFTRSSSNFLHECTMDDC